MSSHLAGTAGPHRGAPGDGGTAVHARDGEAGSYRRRCIVLLLAGIIGSGISIGMFAAIDGWETHVAELRFSSDARDRLRTINSGLDDATDLLWSLRAYLETMRHPVSRSEYMTFSSALRSRVVGLRDTGWAPRVTAAGRETFERDVRATGLPDFQIVERGADGKLVRAADRAEYFPVLYSDPGEINRPILGFDLASETTRAGVIERARATDRPAATPPIQLLNTHRPNGGIMSFIPVTPSRKAEGGAPEPIAGYVLAAFETDAMIRNILATKLNLGDMDLYIFAPGAQGQRLIYWQTASGWPARDDTSLLAAPHWQGTLELVDQQWSAIFVPSAGSVPGMASWIAIAVLAGGLIATGSLVIWLWSSIRRTRHLEMLTINLRQTTEELQRNGAQLTHLARHDALTGLPNRVAFREDIAGFLRRTRRGQSLAVLYLDLDRFKAVNDTLGHPVGDSLLNEVADRLRGVVREVDTITRLGGDEFAIAQSGVEQPRSADTLAQRLIETLSQPYDLGGQLVVVGASVGITLADHNDLDADQLLRRADIALYAAKRHGRGTWRWFEPAMDVEAQLRRGLEMDLRDAIEHDRLELYYQPRISIEFGQVSGFEALLRWRHPSRGLLTPGDFMQCAEDTGLIVPVGAWALRTALCEAAHWPPGVRVAVNLSPRQLADDGLADMIEASLAASGQTGARLELEITEIALVERHAAALATLKRLQACGVLITMDNYGTGYASLSHLRSFPFDRIKIDQSFVGGMTDSPESTAIMRTILRLATDLGIATTAEGVETRAQLELLAANGCTEAQGYLFSPPQPAGEVSRLLAN
ncbi:MAG TPA: EAL domain-containing protein, partial [Acetobacteraceae bacterium]|nr:EAL domain-containing protein [Acetobacteraceae bacterium]